MCIRDRLYLLCINDSINFFIIHLFRNLEFKYVSFKLANLCPFNSFCLQSSLYFTEALIYDFHFKINNFSKENKLFKRKSFLFLLLQARMPVLSSCWLHYISILLSLSEYFSLPDFSLSSSRVFLPTIFTINPIECVTL